MTRRNLKIVSRTFSTVLWADLSNLSEITKSRKNNQGFIQFIFGNQYLPLRVNHCSLEIHVRHAKSLAPKPEIPFHNLHYKI